MIVLLVIMLCEDHQSMLAVMNSQSKTQTRKFNHTKKARCLLLKIGKTLPLETFYSQLLIDKERWKYFQIDGQIYFLFLNRKEIKQSVTLKSERKQKQKYDLLLQIRYSQQQLNNNTKQWMTSYKKIKKFLKNNGQDADSLPTIKEFEENLRPNLNIPIPKRSRDAWSTLQNFYQRTIQLYPQIEAKMYDLVSKSQWLYSYD